MTTRSTRTRRIATALAAGTAAAMVIAGCTTTGDTGSNDDGGGTTITVAQTNAATAQNSGTPEFNLNTNGMVDFLTGNGTGPGSFFIIDNEFNIVPDETNGTIELVSEDPLTVQYTLNPDAVWSDGSPITTDDLLISWAIASGYYDDATLDPATGETVSGTTYFALAGSTSGVDTTEFPEIDKEAGTLTLTYGAPFVDWNLVNLIGKPALAYAEAAGVTVEELSQLLEDTPRGDPAAPREPIAELVAAGELYNSGYALTEMPTDPTLLLSAGPFVISDFQADDGGFIEFSKNPNWRGQELAYDTLIIRFIGDANAQITALRNNEVDVIEPQPSAETLTALEDAGADVITGDQLSYDHVDLTFTSPVWANPDWREAFLLTIPRQQILEAIVTPVNPEAEVLNSQMFVPNQAAYADAVAVNGYDVYGEPDIARATELLAGATPEITILYNSNNPNRVDSFLAIQASAQQAGFIVNDGGSPDWSTLLGSGTYDVSIFGWISPGAGYASLPQIWQTGGGGNYNGYSNAQIDALAAESQITIDDEERLEEIQIEIDTLTQQDFYGLPLFQTPGLVASNGTVDGLAYNGGQTGVIWNALSWTITE